MKCPVCNFEFTPVPEWNHCPQCGAVTHYQHIYAKPLHYHTPEAGILKVVNETEIDLMIPGTHTGVNTIMSNKTLRLTKGYKNLFVIRSQYPIVADCGDNGEVYQLLDDQHQPTDIYIVISDFNVLNWGIFAGKIKI